MADRTMDSMLVTLLVNTAKLEARQQAFKEAAEAIDGAFMSRDARTIAKSAIARAASPPATPK